MQLRQLLRASVWRLDGTEKAADQEVMEVRHRTDCLAPQGRCGQSAVVVLDR